MHLVLVIKNHNKLSLDFILRIFLPLFKLEIKGISEVNDFDGSAIFFLFLFNFSWMARLAVNFFDDQSSKAFLFNH